MGEAAEHVFNRKYASAALRQAMENLAARHGQSLDDVDGMTLGEAYRMAVDTYGNEDLPEFWRVWSQWNDAPDDPAPTGDL